jgi:hypothetical protein
MDITRDVMRLKQEGKTLAETRREIDRKYLRFGAPTPTPVPPS